MYQLILNVHPDEPPQCSQIEIMGFPFWTYGGLLVYDNSASTQLIDYNRMYPPYKPPSIFSQRYDVLDIS